MQNDPLLASHSNKEKKRSFSFGGFEMVSFLNIGMLILAIAIPLVIAFSLSSVGGGGESDWYKHLKKPSWTPPSWVFPVMWTTLYILMGISSWLIWKEGGFRAQAFPLGWYVVQLALNFAWTPLFFGLKRPDISFAEIIVLFVAVIINVVFFYRVKPLAAYLFVPYILWICVAATLNGYIWMNNPVDRSGGYGITAPLRGGTGIGTPGVSAHA